uniref:Uncharacterized protein n=1 Tax=Arundo donax TaxID=35708 RepID=A0A0A9BD49_ARUDO
MTADQHPAYVVEWVSSPILHNHPAK